MNSLLSFNDLCLLEALIRSSFPDGKIDQHYDERVSDRILNLKISAIADDSKKKVNISPEKIAEAERFYSKCLQLLSDPDGEFLKNISVPPYRFGRVKLGTLLMIDSGKTLYPLFRSLNKKDKAGTMVYDEDQRSYWIYTMGEELKTIITQEFDEVNKSYFAKKEMTHRFADIRNGLKNTDPKKRKIANQKKDELDYISVATKLDLSPDKLGNWIKNFTVVDLNIEVVFDTSMSANEQFEKFARSIDPNYGQTPPPAETNVIMSNRELTSDAPLEVAQDKSEISLTPDQTWFMTYNDKNEVWGAQPILDSRIVASGNVGNAIMLTLGLKFLHWVTVEDPKTKRKYSPYNVASAQEKGTFTPFSNTIDKGDVVTIGRQNKDGSWLIRQGKIKTVSNADSTHKFPFIGLEGAAKTFMISQEEGARIFVPFIPNRIGESLALTFGEWLNLRS